MFLLLGYISTRDRHVTLLYAGIYYGHGARSECRHIYLVLRGYRLSFPGTIASISWRFSGLSFSLARGTRSTVNIQSHEPCAGSNERGGLLVSTLVSLGFSRVF